MLCSQKELRVEDYLANRKGPTGSLLGGSTMTQTDNKTGGLFGQQTSQASAFVFGQQQQNQPAFGTSTSKYQTQRDFMNGLILCHVLSSLTGLVLSWLAALHDEFVAK